MRFQGEAWSEAAEGVGAVGRRFPHLASPSKPQKFRAKMRKKERNRTMTAAKEEGLKRVFAFIFETRKPLQHFEAEVA